MSGIKITTNFDMKTNLPLDGRVSVNLLSDILTPYDGMIVYQQSDKIHYKYIDGVFQNFTTDNSLNTTSKSTTGAINEIKTGIDDITTHYSDIIAKYIKLMQSNSPVIIDCKGDSTYYGTTTGGVQTAEPVNVVLQKVLRGYFNNSNILVNNVGIGGDATSDVIGVWGTYISSTTANIVIINYCLNDPYKGVTPAQYKANLKSMVLQTRSIGKEIIFDLPNQNINIPWINVNANQINSEGTKYYANIMRSVSIELDVPIINNLESVEAQWENMKAPTETLFDGVHPLQTFYNYKAVQMARYFIFNEMAKNSDFIPCYSNLFKYYGSTHDASLTFGAKYGWGADKIRIAFWVDKPSDLSLHAHLASSNGFAISNVIATNFNATLDNVVLLTNFNVVKSGTTAAGIEYKEILIGKNLKRGLHYLEIDGVDAKLYITYLRLTTAKYNCEVLPITIGSITKKISNLTNYVIKDLPPIPITLLNTVIELDCYLCDGFGFQITGDRSSVDQSTISSGILVSGEIRTGVFNVGLLQTCDNAYLTDSTRKILSPQNALLNTWQNIKILIDTTNSKLSLYISNVKISELTLLDPKLQGGFISLLRVSSDTTTDSNIYIKNLNYRYGVNVIV